MTRLTPLSPRIVKQFLEEHGFRLDRIKGSHHLYVHDDGRHTVVPVHGNEDVEVGIVTSILRAIDLSRNDLLVWLGRKR